MSDHIYVYNLLKRIEATASRTEKEALVADLAQNELGRFAIEWAYDPFITFGIRVPRRDESMSKGVKLALRQALIKPLLAKLASRSLTGNAAEFEVAEVMGCLDEEGAEILFRILSKDLKCGVAESTLNKVVPGIVPTFCVMRANAFEVKRVKKWPVGVEPKLDGFRYTFIARHGGGGFFTRSGKRAPSCDFMVPGLLSVAKDLVNSVPAMQEHMLDKDGSLAFILDGEMTSGNFNETSGALRRESEQATNAVFHIFDMMHWDDFDAVGSVGLTYEKRRFLVDEFVAQAQQSAFRDQIKKTPRYICSDEKSVMEFYEKFRARGLEGAMVKSLDGLYDKKKSYGWMKIKPEETEDLRIVGAYPGDPATKYENSLGGLIVARGSVEVHVGGGFSDTERDEIWGLFQKELMRAPPGAAYRSPKNKLGWIIDGYFEEPLLINRLIEVEYHEVTPDGSLRHPRFIRFRDDKAGEVESKEKADE